MTEFEKYCNENNIVAESCSPQKAFECGQKSVENKWRVYNEIKPPYVSEEERTRNHVVTIQEWFICIVDFKDGKGSSRMPLAYDYDSKCFKFEEVCYDGYVLAWKPLPEIPEELKR